MCVNVYVLEIICITAHNLFIIIIMHLYVVQAKLHFKEDIGCSREHSYKV